VTTIVFFNNKGGVGKTTLTYHLAHMLARLGYRVLAADFDPQANLTSAFLDEEQLEDIWEPAYGQNTVLSAVAPILQGTGDINIVPPIAIADRLWLLPGHLGLSRFEDMLSDAWPNSRNGQIAALRQTTAFHRLIRGVADEVHADATLVDVGPNLGALNRSAILAADLIIVPLAADLFSLQGLRNLGPTVREWRRIWGSILTEVQNAGGADFALPPGTMQPAGYVVLQHAVRLDRPVRAFQTWLARIPGVYSECVVGDGQVAQSTDTDPNCLATLRNYRSLMPYAQEARKPMFDLKPADGAIGGHQALVRICYDEFRGLALEVARRCGLPALG
jgi:chromosome partitioning protein